MYISLITFPHLSRLNLEYDFPISYSPAVPPVTLLAIAVLTGMALFAVLIAKKQRLYSFCIIWFLGNLVIESSFVPLELVFEHRTYLPSTFFLLLAVVPLYRLFLKNRMLFYTICAVILVILPILTYERNKVWKDTRTLYLDCLKKSPNKYRVHYNLAHEYERLFEMDKAIKHYGRAIELKPNNIASILARKRIAKILAQKGRYQEAIIEISIVLSKVPGDSDALKLLQTYQQYRRQQLQRR
jgi:tetratricopeptide (TPR) repeat protein